MDISLEKVNLNNSYDYNCDDVTDESSPNSVQKYCGIGSQKENVLLNNKGKIKDLQSFKSELLKFGKSQDVYRSVCIPMIDQSESMNIAERIKSRDKTLSMKTPFVNLKCVRSSLFQKPCLNWQNDESMNNNFNQACYKANFVSYPKKFSGMTSKLSLIRSSRSVSRKLSSCKILHLLQKSIYYEESC